MPKQLKQIKKLNVERPYLIELWWVDARSFGGWKSFDEVMEWINHFIVPFKSVGWLLHKDNDHLLLVGSKALDQDGNILSVGDIQWIPRCWVIKIRRLK